MVEELDEAALIERIGELERSKSAGAAEQARLTVQLDTARRAVEAARGIPTAKRGKGLGSEIALARHDSPNQGGRHLGFARALVHEMPHTLAALEAGVISEWRATLIVRESACLSIEDRAPWMPSCAPIRPAWMARATSASKPTPRRSPTAWTPKQSWNAPCVPNPSAP